MEKYVCDVCGYVYDEAAALPHLPHFADACQNFLILKIITKSPSPQERKALSAGR